MIFNPVIYSGKKLPELDNPGSAEDLLEGKQLVDQYGEPLTGTMPRRSVNDLTASGETVTVPAGYYPDQVLKSVAAATQATPSISVSSGGLITASAVQEAGYVTAGTKSATKQLTTQAAATITPGISAKTAVAAGRYTTGAVTVAGSINLAAGNIRGGVSIFGVVGSYMKSVGIQVTNNTSYAINVFYLSTAGIAENKSLAKGYGSAFSVPINSIVVVTSQYQNISATGTNFENLFSGSAKLAAFRATFDGNAVVTINV